MESVNTTNTVKIIAIGGRAGSGRKTLANAIGGNLISQETFILDNAPKRILIHPHLVNNRLLFDTLTALKNGKDVVIGDKTLRSTPVILFEGPFAFSDNEVANLCDLKIYVDCDSDTTLARIIARDFKDNDLYEILGQWDTSKYVFDQSIAPMGKRADIVIPNQDRKLSDRAGVNLIKSYIRMHSDNGAREV